MILRSYIVSALRMFQQKIRLGTLRFARFPRTVFEVLGQHIFQGSLGNKWNLGPGSRSVLVKYVAPSAFPGNETFPHTYILL